MELKELNVVMDGEAGNLAVMVGDAVPRRSFAAPAVVFITGRQCGLRPEQAAHRATGRNRATGELTLAVGVRQRRNGLVHFDADLWRLDLDLHPDTIRQLYRHWRDLNAACSLPKKLLRRMDCHFSRTTIIFEATVEQVEDWREFLRELLMDSNSFVSLVQGREIRTYSGAGFHCCVDARRTPAR